jgi:3-methyladenine DNA glycosylase AlkD
MAPEPTSAGSLVRAVREALAAQANPERAAAQQAYMRSAWPFHGVPLPDVRTAVTAILRQHRPADRAAWREAILQLWDGARYREEWYAALALARSRSGKAWAVAPDSLELWEHLIRTGAWWDVCDEIAEHLVGPLLIAHPERMTPILRAWSTDPDRWIRRVAILAQNRRRSDTDVDLLATCLAGSLDDTDFFARKAIGWALREYSKTDPDWVRAYVDAHAGRLSALSTREALRLIR